MVAGGDLLGRCANKNIYNFLEESMKTLVSFLVSMVIFGITLTPVFAQQPKPKVWVQLFGSYNHDEEVAVRQFFNQLVQGLGQAKGRDYQMVDTFEEADKILQISVDIRQGVSYSEYSRKQAYKNDAAKVIVDTVNRQYGPNRWKNIAIGHGVSVLQGYERDPASRFDRWLVTVKLRSVEAKSGHVTNLHPETMVESYDYLIFENDRNTGYQMVLKDAPQPQFDKNIDIDLNLSWKSQAFILVAANKVVDYFK